MAAFSTVSLMRERPGTIRRFVDYYRSAGAREILIFLDCPVPGLAVERPAVVVVCDEAFWAVRGGRPEVLEHRQRAVYLAGLERCGTPWLLVVDADEFVFGDRPIPVFLDRIPEGVGAVSVPTAEAVWGPGDRFGEPFASTYFRTAWPVGNASRLLRRLVFGRASGQMRNGLTGHGRGKEFVRLGRGIDTIGNHRSWRGGEEVTVPAARIGRAFEGMYVGHFDGLDLTRWERKWWMRTSGETVAVGMSGPRKAQMALIARGFQEGDAARRALFARYYRLSRLQYLALAALGHAFRREIFAPAAPAAAVQADRLRTSPTMS